MEDLSVYVPNNLLYTQERLSKYRPGGYHPVCLGDVFKNNRYQVNHKLGWGGFSTVWLAYDREQGRWVSLKIMTADSPSGSRERDNIQFLQNHQLCSQYIVQLLDDFTHHGPNGTHQCLVFELLGPPVDKVLQEYYESQERLETGTILRMSKQLLEGVEFIHRSGMGHGDISGRNVAFSRKTLSNATKEELFEVLGTPEVEQLTRIDGNQLPKGLPETLVKATEWDEWVDEDDEDIRIIDFGESFFKGKEPIKIA